MLDMSEVFAHGGLLDNALPSYSYREGQYGMAELVTKAFSEGRHAVIEAGTGTGKSFAYLAPIMASLAEDKSRRFVVATSTIPLEKQLYEKDIPFLKEALSSDIEVAVLYGRANYLCMRKYREAGDAGNDANASLFSEWVESTDSGARADIHDPRIARLFPPLASDDKDCASFRCPFYQECFFYNARRRTEKADLIVTNHHILLYDAKYRAESDKDFSDDAVLPSYQYAVIDEAHHIEKEATEIFSEAFSSRLVSRYLDYMTRHERRFGSASILDFLSTEEKVRGTGKSIAESIAHIRTLLIRFDEDLSSMMEEYRGKESDVLFLPDFYQRFGEKIRDSEWLGEELRKIEQTVYDGYSENPSESNVTALELLMRYASVLSSFGSTLTTWMRFSDWDGRIPYAVSYQDGRYEIRISPMDTGPVLSKFLLSNLESVIYSSATLSVNGGFQYFEERSGLKEEKERVLSGIFPSPFEYRKNLMLLLPHDGVSFHKDRSAEYSGYVAEAVYEAINAAGGGALVLFTSKDMMNSVYSRLRGRIDDLMKQDDAALRSSLLSAFCSREDSSLLALSSFWEGIDAPGRTLRLVIIVKLPFSVPTAPIEAARSMNIEKRGGRVFFEMSLPQATLKLKQGLGRLIRSEEDRGVVLILDNRILSHGYGRVMLSSLPECYIPEDASLGNIASKIERFLY